jgi:Flp pilus assembly pilin Flp
MFADLKAIFRAALSDRKGVTALEYGVIAAATIVTGLAVFSTIGGSLNTIFTGVSNALK